MRVTNKILTDNYLRNLNRNLLNMQKYQDQLSSGKEVSKPSDDPLLVSKIMSLDNNIMQNEQYNKNIEDSIGWVETQDSALSNLTSTLQRIRELIVYGSNETLSETDRIAIKDEVEMEIGQIADILNTNFDGRYIFAGQETTETPYEVAGNLLTYNGDDNNIQREISKGVLITLETSGEKIMTASGASAANENLGVYLENVVDALGSGDIDQLSNELLADMDHHLENIIQVRSKVGAIYNRLEAAKSRNESENLNLKTLLSKREDIDIAEKYMEYSNMRAVYQASLATGAQLLQPSLLDYLR